MFRKIQKKVEPTKAKHFWACARADIHQNPLLLLQLDQAVFSAKEKKYTNKRSSKQKLHQLSMYCAFLHNQHKAKHGINIELLSRNSESENLIILKERC